MFYQQQEPQCQLCRGCMIGTAARKCTPSLFFRYSLIPSFSRENVCVAMGYIVDLMVVMESLFRSRSSTDMSPRQIQLVVREVADSNRKTEVHDGILKFLKANPAPVHMENDVFMGKIIDLICVACQ
jgi:hypothetical protein